MKKRNPGRSDALSWPSPLSGGFTLVEVTIAIGIFAFVIVAVLGLFSVALRQRGDSALEARAVLIAQQVFGGIPGYSLSNALSYDNLIQGPNSPTLKNLTNGLVLGFADKGTSVSHIFSDIGAWDSSDVGDPSQPVATKAYVSATNVAPGLYSVSVQVGYPAYLPAAKRRVQTFSTLVGAP